MYRKKDVIDQVKYESELISFMKFGINFSFTSQVIFFVLAKSFIYW
jgi:hypothetical protein